MSLVDRSAFVIRSSSKSMGMLAMDNGLEHLFESSMHRSAVSANHAKPRQW
jgi:hypothetical protein